MTTGTGVATPPTNSPPMARAPSTTSPTKSKLVTRRLLVQRLASVRLTEAALGSDVIARRWSCGEGSSFVVPAAQIDEKTNQVFSPIAHRTLRRNRKLLTPACKFLMQA